MPLMLKMGEIEIIENRELFELRNIATLSTTFSHKRYIHLPFMAKSDLGSTYYFLFLKLIYPTNITPLKSNNEHTSPI